MVYTTRDNTSEQQRNNSKDKTASMQLRIAAQLLR